MCVISFFLFFLFLNSQSKKSTKPTVLFLGSTAEAKFHHPLETSVHRRYVQLVADVDKLVGKMFVNDQHMLMREAHQHNGYLSFGR